MATPAVQQFHNDNMRQERERVLLRIANGTKASSPKVIGVRQSHPTYKGLPDNSTGSKTMPFFANKDESHCPIEEKIRMRGGVLHTKAGKEYGYEILKRRARDDINQRAAVEGLPPTPAPLTELSEEEQKSLELDQLLNALDDAIETGDVRAINQAINITLLPRLLVALAPTFSGNKLGSLESFIGSMKGKLLAQFEYNGRNMEAIQEEIASDLMEEGNFEADSAAFTGEFQRRLAQRQRGMEVDKSVVRIYNLLVDCLLFIKFLAEALSRGLEGKSLRSFIVAAAKEAFKMNRKDANRFIEVGFEAAPVDRAELAGAFAGQQEPNMARVEEIPFGEEEGDAFVERADGEEEEAPGGAAAGEPRFFVMYKIGDTYYDMSQGANYEEWVALRPPVGNARKAFDAMTRGRLQAGDTKEQAMAYVIQRKSNA